MQNSKAAVKHQLFRDVMSFKVTFLFFLISNFLEKVGEKTAQNHLKLLSLCSPQTWKSVAREVPLWLYIH